MFLYFFVNIHFSPFFLHCRLTFCKFPRIGNSVLASVMYFCTPCSIPPCIKETLKNGIKETFSSQKGRESLPRYHLVDHIHMYRILFIFLTRIHAYAYSICSARNSRVIFPLSPYPELTPSSVRYIRFEKVLIPIFVFLNKYVV